MVAQIFGIDLAQPGNLTRAGQISSAERVSHIYHLNTFLLAVTLCGLTTTNSSFCPFLNACFFRPKEMSCVHCSFHDLNTDIRVRQHGPRPSTVQWSQETPRPTCLSTTSVFFVPFAHWTGTRKLGSISVDT